MASSAIERLRMDLGLAKDDTVALPDVEAQDLLDEAAETFSDAPIALAFARVLAIRRYLASSAKMASYRANNSSEDLSDVFKHLQQLLTYWEKVVQDVSVVEVGIGGAAFGKPTILPPRVKLYPG